MVPGLRRKGLWLLGRLLLLVLGLTVALVLAEVVTRGYLRWFRPDFGDSAPARQFTDSTASFTITYTFAEGGTRQPCRVPPKEDPYNLAVIGDSFAFGVGVPDCRDFPSLVNAAQRHVAVYNLGKPAAGMTDYQEVTDERLCRGRVDGTLLLLFGNDFLEGPSGLLKRGHKHARLAWLMNMRLAMNPPGETASAILAALRLIDQPIPGTPLALEADQLNVEPPDGGLRLRVSLANDLAQSKEYVHYLSFPPPDLAATNLAHLNKLLARLKECSGDVWVAVVPNGAILSGKQRAYVAELGGDLPPLDTPEEILTMVREAALANGAQFLETNAAFAAEADLAYYVDDVHWTPRGHEIMAGVVINALAAKGIGAGPR